MRLLLITTLPNKVHESLSSIPEIELETIDLACGISRRELFHSIDNLLELRDYDILLTYRCPFLIPEELFARFDIRLNIHPLPLPEFAGLNPWGKFLESGNTDAETVLHEIISLPDSGRIIRHEKYAIPSPSHARETADHAASQMIKKYILSL